MSKVIENLKEQQKGFILQRAGLKDQIDAVEENLKAISFAMQVQEALAKEEAEEDMATAEAMAAELDSVAASNEN